MANPAFAAFVDTLKDSERPMISPSRLASVLALQIQDFAACAGVHRNTLRNHPESARVQAFSRNVVRVLSAASDVQPDRESIVFWLMNQPLRPFRHKTAFELICEGRSDDVVDYLASIESGFAG